MVEKSSSEGVTLETAVLTLDVKGRGVFWIVPRTRGPLLSMETQVPGGNGLWTGSVL